MVESLKTTSGSYILTKTPGLPHFSGLHRWHWTLVDCTAKQKGLWGLGEFFIIIIIFYFGRCLTLNLSASNIPPLRSLCKHCISDISRCTTMRFLLHSHERKPSGGSGMALIKVTAPFFCELKDYQSKAASYGLMASLVQSHMRWYAIFLFFLTADCFYSAVKIMWIRSILLSEFNGQWLQAGT